MTKNSSEYPQLSSRQKRNAFRLALVNSIGPGLISIYYFFNIEISFFYPNVQLGILSLASLFSLLLLRKDRTKAAIALMLTATYFSLTMIVLKISGLDIMMAILGITITYGIASATLPPADVRKAVSASFIVSSFFLFLYFAEPLKREPITTSTNATWVITGLVLATFIVLILRQFSSYALRTKLILAFIFLSSVGISIAFILANVNTRRILTNNAHERLLAGALSSANNIDAFLKYSTASVSTASTYLDVRAYFLLSPKERQGSKIERQVQNLLYTLNNHDPNILSYGLLDLNGINILDSNTRNIGVSEAEQDYYLRPLNARSTYISPVLYLPNEDEGVLFFSAPVYNDMGVILGILRAKYKASVLQDLLTTEKDVGGQGAFSVLFDSNHIVLAHGANQELIGRTSFTPNTEDIESLRKNFLLPSHIRNDQLSLNIDVIEEGLSDFVRTPYFSSPETALNIPVSGAITQLDTIPWLIATAQAESIFLAPAQEQSQQALITTIVLIIFAAFSGMGLANILVKPILRLQNVAQQFAEGDLDVKASVDTNDAIGILASTFNDLASRLRGIVQTLEFRIEERTKDLEARTNYLEGAAEVSRAVGSIMDPNTLINEVVQLIKDHFGLYYAGLFLVDNNNEWAILKAGTGKAGQRMLKRKHKIKIGEGMIGWSVENAEARIALDVGADAVRFENPDLPETRSEGALPLRSRGRVIGALTVQSVEESAFDESIITTLQTMTDQIAVALDNAELFVKTEAALLSERRAYGQLSQQSWRTLSQSQAIPRFIVQEDGTVNSVKDIDKTIDVAQAMEKGELLEDDRMTAIIPIKNHDYVLGGIKIRKTEGAKPWTKEELEITQAISNQLSVALESARLFDQTQRKAQREAIISDISAKIGASMRLDTILKTTAKELGQALGSPEVTFELTDPETAENK